MRCKACDKILSNSELLIKDSRGKFLDMCGSCADQSYLTYGIEIDEENKIIKFYKPHESEFKWSYVGGFSREGDTDLMTHLIGIRNNT